MNGEIDEDFANRNPKQKDDANTIKPFRCRVGCIVALRHQDVNTVTCIEAKQPNEPATLLPSEQLIDHLVFVPPIPTRDSGLALIGKRILCHLPKDYQAKTRSFQGTVLALPGYGRKKRREIIRVHLLVEDSIPSMIPGMKLVRSNDKESGAQPLSNKEHKFQIMEERIQGKGFVRVQVALQNFTHSKPGLAWEIAKRVPPMLRGHGDGATYSHYQSNSIMHMGDGVDSPEQQISNYKWEASRYLDSLLTSTRQRPTNSFSRELVAGGFVGEVIKVHKQSDEAQTLALVTIRRLFLPEDTITGRQNHHGDLDIFHDLTLQVSGRKGTATVAKDVLLQVPIEQLVVIGNLCKEEQENNGDVFNSLMIKTGYSLEHDRYVEGFSQSKSCLEVEIGDAGSTCHRCLTLRQIGKHRVCKNNTCPLLQPFQPVAWCRRCRVDLKGDPTEKNASSLPCCQGLCDCRSCASFYVRTLDERFMSIGMQLSPDVAASDGLLNYTIAVARGLQPTVFGLPKSFFDSNARPRPTSSAMTKVKKDKTPKKNKRDTNVIQNGEIITPNKRGRKRKHSKLKHSEEEDFSIFIPTCAKYLSLTEIRERKATSGTNNFPQTCSDRPRILRQSRLETEKVQAREEKVSSSRATRANQRRFMKDVVALGAAGLGLDTLASREPMLRFDRSSIHAWGVFADEDIAADTMLVEYRGELISRALADKREKEYEKANIPDYQFRIDNEVVCDATKQGNVARFINASCSPNCYTKIITTEGTKRIVIYAKRDIRIGEELCYDYKFPLEYDETKRIPCHCGSKDCRGFMNWDKRYVTIPTELSAHSKLSVKESIERDSSHVNTYHDSNMAHLPKCVHMEENPPAEADRDSSASVAISAASGELARDDAAA